MEADTGKRGKKVEGIRMARGKMITEESNKETERGKEAREAGKM